MFICFSAVQIYDHSYIHLQGYILCHLMLCISLLGFMFGTNVFDKDGISAAVVMAEMASYLNRQGLTLTEQLHKLYQRFGVLHNSCINWCTCQFHD